MRVSCMGVSFLLYCSAFILVTAAIVLSANCFEMFYCTFSLLKKEKRNHNNRISGHNIWHRLIGIFKPFGKLVSIFWIS